MKKKDPRYSGSNNIGATNIARTSGWRLGMITLILDVLKTSALDLSNALYDIKNEI